MCGGYVIFSLENFWISLLLRSKSSRTKFDQFTCFNTQNDQIIKLLLLLFESIFRRVCSLLLLLLLLLRLIDAVPVELVPVPVEYNDRWIRPSLNVDNDNIGVDSRQLLYAVLVDRSETRVISASTHSGKWPSRWNNGISSGGLQIYKSNMEWTIS